MDKLNLTPNRSFRVNLISVLTGLLSLSIVVFLAIGFYYNSFDLFKEIIAYKYIKDQNVTLRLAGVITLVVYIIYLFLTVIITANAVFSDEDDKVININKSIFKVTKKEYFNYDLSFMILFPIPFIIEVLAKFLKKQYYKYIDD